MRVLLNTSTTTPTLLLALGGLPLLTIISRNILGDSMSIAGLLPFDLILWAMVVVVLIVVVYFEKLPLASIGLKRPRVTTIIWGLLLLLSINFMLSPIMMWVV